MPLVITSLLSQTVLHLQAGYFALPATCFFGFILLGIVEEGSHCCLLETPSQTAGILQYVCEMTTNQSSARTEMAELGVKLHCWACDLLCVTRIESDVNHELAQQ